MDEDGSGSLTFDEVSMQDMVDEWTSKCAEYAEGITVGGWYYDCRTATVIIRLLIDDDTED